MLEVKLIRRIQKEYGQLLQSHESELEAMTEAKLRLMIQEVKNFWYRNRKPTEYILNHIAEEDKVAFLAGAIKLDISNSGHYEFIHAGKHRIVCDPFYKMSAFYINSGIDMDFKYFNNYFVEGIKDALDIVRKYSDDFWIFPIEYIGDSENRDYRKELCESAEIILLRLIDDSTLETIEDFCQKYRTYEEIEQHIITGAPGRLLYNSYQDSRKNLREKIEEYIAENSAVQSLYEDLDEPKRFVILTTQYIMQAIGIINTAQKYHMRPFIRNGIAFNYYRLLCEAFEGMVESTSFFETYLLYLIQKIDMTSMDYNEAKKRFGNGKLLEAVMNAYDDEKKTINHLPLPNDVMSVIADCIGVKNDDRTVTL